MHEVVQVLQRTTTQFSIEMDVKNALDKFKANNKEEIIKAFKKHRRLVSNSDAIRYLLVKNGKRTK